jgi:hypothetical protein
LLLVIYKVNLIYLAKEEIIWNAKKKVIRETVRVRILAAPVRDYVVSV